MTPSLAVCTIALNEAALIGAMLRSVTRLADEVVVGLDTRTTDTTQEIAYDYLAKVLPVYWCDDFSYARNLTLDAATSDWVLILDADERLTPAGLQAVQDVLAAAPSKPASDAITGLSFLIGQFDLTETTCYGVHPSSMRLFRRCPEIRYRGIVHEEPWWLPDPSKTVVALVSGVLAIAHVGYDPSLWNGRNKRERNLRLLEQRVADNPDDRYAQSKLAWQRAVDGPWVDA